jgi:hypothetical protein
VPGVPVVAALGPVIGGAFESHANFDQFFGMVDLAPPTKFYINTEGTITYLNRKGFDLFRGLGSLASRFKRTGKVVATDFAIVLMVAHGEIVRFKMLEDSFAVSQMARD